MTVDTKGHERQDKLLHSVPVKKTKKQIHYKWEFANIQECVRWIQRRKMSSKYTTKERLGHYYIWLHQGVEVQLWK